MKPFGLYFFFSFPVKESSTGKIANGRDVVNVIKCTECLGRITKKALRQKFETKIKIMEQVYELTSGIDKHRIIEYPVLDGT